jgi:hypothetical protein
VQGKPLAEVCAAQLTEAEAAFAAHNFDRSRQMYTAVLDTMSEYYAVPLIMQQAKCSWHMREFEMVVADTGACIDHSLNITVLGVEA